MIGSEYLKRLNWIARAFGQGFADDVAFYAETGKRLIDAEWLVADERGYAMDEADTLDAIAHRMWAQEDRQESLAQRALAHGF